MTEHLAILSGMGLVVVGNADWCVSVPKDGWNPQLVAITGEATATAAIIEGSGAENIAGIPVDQLDLLIEALLTARKKAGRSPSINAPMTTADAQAEITWLARFNQYSSGSSADDVARRALETVVAQAEEITELTRARDAALVDAQDYKVRLNALLDDEEDHYG